MNGIIRPVIHRLGVDVVRYRKYPHDLSSQQIEIWEAVSPYTMTNPVRIAALVDAVNYLIANRIEGAFVECGVWKGGSAMAMAMALSRCGERDRDIYLYDTFAGMTRPGEMDVGFNGESAGEIFARNQVSEHASNWCFSPLDEVRKNVCSTGYPAEKFHFVQGRVEDTLPAAMPEKIALLRLDTDWYESTRHELIHLFPLLSENGVLIIDDYGCWAGAKKAVDEYIGENNVPLFLGRIDSEARIAIKPGYGLLQTGGGGGRQ